MKIIHLSAECYPVAKVGGLGDVVGALPKYLRKEQVRASVVLPKYANDWMLEHSFETVYEGRISLGSELFPFVIQREARDSLGFPLYVVDLPGLFDRKGIYADAKTGKAYPDDFQRYTCFPLAALEWIQASDEWPHVIHCHDHHTGLLPFLLTQCRRYRSIKHIPTVFTVHNAEYHGVYDRAHTQLLPDFNEKNIGLLDWDDAINCMAAGLKCCWEITTVSPSYMQELRSSSNGLEKLFQNEQQKSRGILNGIDNKVWNPETDKMIAANYDRRSVDKGKQKNKQVLCKHFGLDPELPTISFIGRLVREKGADLLPELFQNFLESSESVNFIVLGTGNRTLHRAFEGLRAQYIGFFDATLDYNEPLAHQIYAGSDFMIMPSRVEPCGLNQLYCMQYGTIPIVHNIGGLKDTVVDVEQPEGYGITFNDATIEAAGPAIKRALALFNRDKVFRDLRRQVMELDFTWNASAKEYIHMYKELSKQ